MNIEYDDDTFILIWLMAFELKRVTEMKMKVNGFCGENSIWQNPFRPENHMFTFTIYDDDVKCAPAHVGFYVVEYTHMTI